MLKVGSGLFLGSGLMQSAKKLKNEIKERDIKDDTVTEVAVRVFWRLTRLGVIGLLIAVFPIWLLMNQNSLLKQQNEKIDVQNDRINLQNNLIEADRRGALVILMSNIMDQVNEEINKQRPENLEADTIPYKLSDPLIGRIAALSQSLLPYRYLVGDTLTDKEVSFERGQLFLSLVKSNLDSLTYRKIFDASDFSFAFLKSIDLDGSKFHGLNLYGADLTKADFMDAQIPGAYFVGADLSNAMFYRADLYHVDFQRANLTRAVLAESWLDDATLVNANFTEAHLNSAYLGNAFLRHANLTRAELTDANLKNAELKNAILSGTDLSGAKNLSLDQLLTTKSLFGCKGLKPSILEILKKEKPCLFTPEGCPTENN